MIRPAPSARAFGGGARRGLDSHALSGLAAAGLVVLATVGLITSGVLSEGRPLDPGTDCPRDGVPASVNVIALDTTDPLLSAQPLLVGRVVDGVVATLPAGDRLAVAEIREAGLEPALSFNRCVPGTGSNVERNRLRNAVHLPVRSALDSLGTRPEARQSPIIESLIALVDHPQLQPTRGRITIHLLSDALQSSSFASAYGDQPFPPPVNNLLSGVTVRLVVLQNARDAHRQRRGVEGLVAWLRAAGARVEYEPSTWERFEGRPR